MHQSNFKAGLEDFMRDCGFASLREADNDSLSEFCEYGGFWLDDLDREYDLVSEFLTVDYRTN